MTQEKGKGLGDLLGGSSFSGFAKKALEVENSRSQIDVRDELERERKLAEAKGEIDRLGIFVQVSDDEIGNVRPLMYTEETGPYDIEFLRSLSEPDLAFLPPDVRKYWEIFQDKFGMRGEKIDVEEYEREMRRKQLGLD